MMLKIEKGIPIPPKQTGKWKAFLRNAELKDSLVLNEKEERSLRSVAYKYGYCVTRRKLGNGKFRVWFRGKVEGERNAA